MRYFKDNNNQIFAYEDSDWIINQDENGEDLPAVNKFITDELIEITEDEVKVINDAKHQAYVSTDEYKISEAKKYLAESDWIVTKIAEADIEGRDITELKAKYIDKLSHRKLMREVINNAESE